MKHSILAVVSLLPLSVVGWLSVGLSGQAVIDLHGTARAGKGPAPDTVVWLDAPGAPARPQTSRVVVHQRNMTFSPRVLVVRVGTTIDFPNDDRTFHNIFSFHNGKIFDLGMYPVGTERRVLFDGPGLSRLFCNIHPNMAAYVMAVDSPYFALSDASGAFTIAGVPAGSHRYHAWRPGAIEEFTGTWNPAQGALAIEWP